MHFLGIPIVASNYMPPPGPQPRANAAEIRAANEAVLAHGGRLIDCERPWYMSRGFCVLNTGTMVVDPVSWRDLCKVLQA